MRVRLGLQMLAVLAGLVLTSSVCDGLVMDKCELKDHLMARLPMNLLEQLDKVAKLACHAEQTSGFDTGAINQIPLSPPTEAKKKTHEGRKARAINTTLFPRVSPTTKTAAVKEINPVITKPTTKSLSLPNINSQLKANTKPILTTQSPLRKGALPKPTTQSPLRKGALPKPTTQSPLRKGAMPKPTTQSPLRKGAMRKPTTQSPLGMEAMPNSATQSPLSMEPMPNSATQSPLSMEAMPNSATQSPLRMEEMPTSATQNPLRDTLLSLMSNASSLLPNLLPQLLATGRPRPARSADDREWNLYGIFQLSDRVACTSEQKLSLNLCGLPCEKLLDDDITDDIDCVGKILSSIKSKGEGLGEANKLIKKMYGLILQEACAAMTYSQYFAGC